MTTSEIILTFIMAFGGLAIFVFGMHTMSSSFEKVTGPKIEKMLSSLTDNLLKGILVGTAITAVVQSSSAVTVIAIGLVNAGLLSLYGASGVVMGANIGTCATPIILSLTGLEDSKEASVIMDIISIDSITSYLAIVGILFLFLSKKEKTKTIGEILLGASILFFGMEVLSDNVKKFSEFAAFEQIFQTMTNPVLGVLVGTAFTAVIQSSSASTAILQSAALTGVVPFSAAFPLMMGFNIGTTITGILSSIGTSKNAKRTAMMHVTFNVFGVVVIGIAMGVIQLIMKFDWWHENVTMWQIAQFGLFFNVLNTLIFLPFPKLLPWIASKLVSDKTKDDEDDMENALAILDPRFLVSPSIAIQQANNVVVKMGELARTNITEAIKLYTDYSEKSIEHIKEREDIIDRMEDKLNEYLVQISDKPLSDMDSRAVSSLLRLLLEFERIGDYAVNIYERAENMHNKNIVFSDEAIVELQHLGNAIDEIMEMAITVVDYNDLETVMKIEPLEEVIDRITDFMREKHIKRLKTGVCTIDRGITFLNDVNDMERISDHCSNIAIYVLSKLAQKDVVDRHGYIERLHKGEIPEYTGHLNAFQEKYLSQLIKTNEV
ncbi:MAG: Na/Pi cotransporter family protein [Oscillospiraceae bacterium]|jgi:phosphate:Na+ symporter|nr:Na/Pi cotransporter family protein [Oscillospiraceae bacterium]